MKSHYNNIDVVRFSDDTVIVVRIGNILNELNKYLPTVKDVCHW